MSKRNPEAITAYWIISGTSEVSNRKEDLKKIRAALNKEAGIDEADKTVDSNGWKFKISKAPGHPRYQR